MSGKIRKHISRKLRGYTGPYPYHMLDDARFTLMRNIEMKDTVVWYQIRKKTGIFENGERATDWQGWGDHSTYYSHADLFEENSIEGEYFQSRESTPAATSTPSATITTDEVDPVEEDTAHDNDDSVMEILNDTGNASQNKRILNIAETSNDHHITNTGNILIDSVIDITSPSTSKAQGDKEMLIQNGELEKKSSSNVNNISKSKMKNHKDSSSSPNSGYESPEDGEIIDSEEESGVVVEIIDDSDSSDIQIIGEESGINDSVIVIEDNKKSKSKGITNDQKLSAWTSLRHQVSSESAENSDCMILDQSDTCQLEAKHETRDTAKSEDMPVNSTESVDQKIDTSQNTSTSDASHCISENKIVNEDKGLNQGDVIDAYKCDFCDEIFLVPKTIMDHLDSSGHFSGSKVKYDRNKESFMLIEKLVFMKKENLFKRTVAVCPRYSCNKVFSTVYDCALHHRLKHDNVGDLITGLADIVKTARFPNPCFTRACPICNDMNPAAKKVDKINEALDLKLFKKNITVFSEWLTGHFERIHAPFDYNQGDCHFICPECHDVFVDLSRALIHQVMKHQIKPLTHNMEMIVIQTGDVRTRPVPDLVKPGATGLKYSKTNINCASNGSGASSSNSSAGSSSTIENGEFFVIDRKPMPPGKYIYGSMDLEGSFSLEHSTIKQSKAVEMPNDVELGEKSSEMHDQQSQMFLCDYCDFIDEKRLAMYQHLCDEDHTSASIVQVDYNLRPVTMIKQMAVENYASSFIRAVAACPMEGCTRLFPDIFQCSVHVSVFHKVTENIYGVTEVVKSTDIFLPASPVCEVCEVTFTDRYEFNRHIKELDHYPPDCRAKSLPYHVKFVCPYCELIMEAYLPALSHLLTKHPFKVIQNKFRIRLVHASKEVKKKYMLPFSANDVGEARNIEMNLKAIRGLTRRLGKIGKKELCKKRRKFKVWKNNKNRQNKNQKKQN